MDSAIVRLNNVIAGEKSGISKLSGIDWKGGGSFVSFRLLQNKDAKTPLDKHVRLTDIETVLNDLSKSDVQGNEVIYGKTEESMCYTENQQTGEPHED